MSDFDPAKTRPFPAFRVADHLNSPGEVAAYLNDLLDDRDAGLLAFALGELAKARGMPAMAEHTGLKREALYKALRAGSSPRLDTILRVLDALGMRLVVVPTSPDREQQWANARADAEHFQNAVIGMGEIMEQAVNALRGAPPDDCAWSTHDLAGLAAKAAAVANAVLAVGAAYDTPAAEAALAALAKARQGWREVVRDTALQAAEMEALREKGR